MNNNSYVTQEDIVIPKGTILKNAANERGGSSYVEGVIGLGPDFSGWFVVQFCNDAIASGKLKEQ
jgi:hypothetical protein